MLAVFGLGAFTGFVVGLIFAELEKNETFRALVNVNLKPTEDKKFLFCI
jgi:hypothetical protein